MSAQVWQRRFQWRQRTAHAMHSGTGFKFCKCGIDKERGDSDMRIDATVAGSDAPRRKMPRAVFVAAALAFGLLPGMRALAGDPDAPAAAGVQVRMSGTPLRSSDIDRSIQFFAQGQIGRAACRGKM